MQILLDIFSKRGSRGVGEWGSRGEWHSPVEEWGSGAVGANGIRP
ncbi:MAG: hypothetical protein SWX82_16240 [Cyanobacteriota bacterium]|nr:hypothetical protein [Cyanobacteriota bacterium]